MWISFQRQVGVWDLASSVEHNVRRVLTIQLFSFLGASGIRFSIIPASPFSRTISWALASILRC